MSRLTSRPASHLSMSLLLASVLSIAAVPAALAQRSVVGGDEEEEEGKDKKAGDKPADKADKKKQDEAKKKKDDDKKNAEAGKKNAEADKKANGKSAKDGKKDHKPGDVLEDTSEDKKKQDAEDQARKAAEAAAETEQKKKEEEQKKLLEQKKAAEDKRRADTREQRLASAKRVRPLARTSGDIAVAIAIEPGAVVKGAVVEVRLDVARLLDVSDPRLGNKAPLKGLELTAIVTETTGKKDKEIARYAVHSLGAPGAYGFHVTPPGDGALRVQIVGSAGTGSVDVTFPLHVGVWPPPDFDNEDQLLAPKKGA